MSRKTQSIGVLGLVLALFMACNTGIVVVDIAAAETDDGSEDNTKQMVLISGDEDTTQIFFSTQPSSETQGENTSQTIIFEIDDARENKSMEDYLFFFLLILLILVFSLLFIHILMHHRHGGGMKANTPTHSLLAEKNNPIEDTLVPTPGDSQPHIPEDEPYVLPLALTVLDALCQESGAWTASMGNPIGSSDSRQWEEPGAFAIEDGDLEGVIA